MNHSLCLTRLIAKYNDFPGVQADIRRALRYSESQNRMFLQPFINGIETNIDPNTSELEQLQEDTHNE